MVGLGRASLLDFCGVSVDFGPVPMRVNFELAVSRRRGSGEALAIFDFGECLIDDALSMERESFVEKLEINKGSLSSAGARLGVGVDGASAIRPPAVFGEKRPL